MFKFIKGKIAFSLLAGLFVLTVTQSFPIIDIIMTTFTNGTGNF